MVATSPSTITSSSRTVGQQTTGRNTYLGSRVSPQVYDAALLMLRTWSLERRHERESPYAYAELPRGGRGSESNYTGQSLRDWAGVLP